MQLTETVEEKTIILKENTLFEDLRGQVTESMITPT